MANSRDAKVTLKLLIDTKAKRVLFAEAEKDFVDFLFNLLSLPIGTVIKLLTKPAMVGTLGNLYDSIEDLSETYFLQIEKKQSVLNPKPPIQASDVPLLSLNDIPFAVSQKFYSCPNNIYSWHAHAYASDDPFVTCPGCGNTLSKELKFVAAGAMVAAAVATPFGVGAVATPFGATPFGAVPAAVPAKAAGFVKEAVTYMAMDDLVVQPLSTTSSIISLLNKFNVKDVGAIEEKVVDLGMPEALKLLKSSLHSKTVLTSVFLENTGA